MLNIIKNAHKKSKKKFMQNFVSFSETNYSFIEASNNY